MIYKTLVLTGLRANELRTLTVGQLRLEPGAEFLQLDAADEKNRDGNAIPLRGDLAEDLRNWLKDKRTVLSAGSSPGMTGLPSDTRVFTIPTGLRRILDHARFWAGEGDDCDIGPYLARTELGGTDEP